MLLPTLTIVLLVASSASAGPLRFKSKEELLKLLFQRGNVKCGKGEYECDDGQTCCQMKDKSWSCCPYKNAVCCEDQLHCCPGGTVCNVAARRCETKDPAFTVDLIQLPNTDKLISSTKVPSLKIKAGVKKVICPNGYECPDETTCCEMSTGAYGCCPMPKANCCPDHIHCCPSDQKCDDQGGKCINGKISQPWLEKFEAKVSDVICPDQQSTCPAGTTCCSLGSGTYGCCPLPNATCCSDHLHCCPQGYKCDVTGKSCLKGDRTIQWYKKEKSIVRMERPKPENILCPDGRSCPADNTCCPLSGGKYGCCPLPHATCCSDLLHCCPEGFTCHPSMGTCTMGLLSVPWVNKTPTLMAIPTAVARVEENYVICPGEVYQCPDKNTCCRTESKTEYSCCPLPHAVCCKDYIHCCPSGYTCSGKGMCAKEGEQTIVAIKKTSAIKRVAPPTGAVQKLNVDIIICKGGHTMCPDGMTCCDDVSGFGCCPIPNAVCCSDKRHCCPQGYTCDSAAGTCNNGLQRLPWSAKLAAQTVYEKPKPELLSKMEAVVCPDQTSQCPDGNTCCKLATGQYGCCPLPNAVCCNDHIHCCPNGYTCDASGSKCNKGLESIPWVKKVPANNFIESVLSPPKSLSVGTVTCPDQESQCPDGNTCCKLASGQYGCCPLPNAVCCNDHIHCCPNGYTCDVTGGKCNKGLESIPWVKKVPANSLIESVLYPNVRSVLCPDRQGTCPDGSTCCIMDSGKYGCCPLPNATCCQDHTHCCPHGYTCDLSQAKCNPSPTQVRRSVKIVSKSLSVSAVTCPDQESQCPDGNTCCKLASGQYGCCPLPNAVCCNDHVHCCPNGYTCDVTGSKCNKGLESIPWVKKVPANDLIKSVLYPNVRSVLCPDQQGTCPDGSTCCIMDSGKYGCCPLPNATCCQDHTHCCPHGYTCDLSQAKCNPSPTEVRRLVKIVSKSLSVGAVTCPDQESQCPDGNTCCKLASGQYGCCPLPNAVCCNDHIHCCPNGYTCDVMGGKCNKGLESIPWVKKVPANNLIESVLYPNVRSVLCPDQQGTCPDGSTCCIMDSGKYGCCPLPNATCCQDHTHCCPHGYTCDLSQAKCNPSPTQVKKSVKIVSKAFSVGAVICPDQTSQCPDGNTCCKLATGQYGCCPLPNAVCCNDHIHCCPNGYTCDVTGGKCNKNLESIPWVKKVPANDLIESVLYPNVRSVLCPDQQGTCPDGSTCCIMDSGKYGCCPLPNATCCQDHTHCCPHGYTCDLSQAKCNPSPTQVKKSVKIISKSLSVGAITCPDQESQCPDGNTCCKLASGQYGCCPLPNAVCCNDHIHCCPNGYTCDVTGGKCNKGLESIPWVKKVPANSLIDSVLYPNMRSVLCPDRQGTCPDGSTCCIMDSGKYGCCPLPNATCCQDHTHCCPHGYTCDLSQAKCNPSPTQVKKSVKIVSKSLSVGAVTCPDQESQCPDGNTCCKLATGQYGCCPLPKAVCCNDHIHCCPNGYMCDVTGNKCNKGALSLPWVEKVPAETREYKYSAVTCPDGESECPDGNTCCRMRDGSYGCCPLAEAVCCSDELHCCPHGYTCNVQGSTCNKGDLSIPWILKNSAQKRLSNQIITKLESVICPDGHSECPDGCTCCKTPSGVYGCCPIPDALCCNDGVHCCPKGYTCDPATGACKNGSFSLPWFQKNDAQTIPRV